MADNTGSTAGRGGHWLSTAPPAPILAASFLFAGLGTVVLGPLLPQLLSEWQLTDGRGGLLLLAKFTGAFLGGATIPRKLRLGTFTGHLLAALGFAAFALAHGLALALPALLLTGLGLGEVIASTNILATQRWPHKAGSALALLNFFWSLGAVSTGLLVAALLPRLGWRVPIFGLAALFAVTAVLTLLRGKGMQPLRQVKDAHPFSSEAHSAKRSTYLVYGLLLLLYGGLETCLTGWLSTYTLRVTGGSLLGGQSGFVVLWAALTVGRLLGSALMRRWTETAVQRGSLALTFVCTIALAWAHAASSLTLICVLLGLTLAPVFPSTFALLMRHPVPPRMGGLILAVSGLGAALFPWMMGVVSTQTGSLRIAMLVPAVLAPAMLLLTFATSKRVTSQPPDDTSGEAKNR